MNDSPDDEPDEEVPANPGGNSVIPDRRTKQVGKHEKKQGLRIGQSNTESGDQGGRDAGIHRGLQIGRGIRTRDIPETGGEIVRLEPEDSLIARPKQKVSYSDLVHDPERRVRREYDGYESDGRRKSVSWKWMLVIFVGVLGILVFSIFVVSKSAQQGSGGGVPEEAPLAIEPRADGSGAEEIARLLGSQEEAGVLFLRFLRARSVDELRGVVREGDVPTDLSLVANRPTAIPADGKIPANSAWQVFSAEAPVYAILRGYLPDGARFQAYFVLENGDLRLDWRATIAYSTASYEELNQGTGDPSEVRAWVKPSVYFSASFPENEYQSYLLYSNLDDPPVWGYVRRSSETGERMRRVFGAEAADSGAGSPKRLLLSLAKQEEVLKNQWLIAEILHTDWITR